MTRPHYWDRDGAPINSGIEFADMMTWGRLREDEAYMRVGHDEVGTVLVTTVWHGINVVLGSDPPYIFETMIFGGAYDLKHSRYVTRDEAAQGHQRTVEDIEAGRIPWFLAREG